VKSYSIKAFHLAEKLKLKDVTDRFALSSPLTVTPLEASYKLSADSYVYIFNFGSIVFFNVAEDIQKVLLDKARKSDDTQPARTTADEFTIEVVDEDKLEVSFNKITLKEISYEKVRLVAMILAESAALEYFELVVDDLLDRTKQFTNHLRNKGRLIRNTSELIKFIGFCLSTKQDIISNLYVVDAPDEVWEDQSLAKLYEDFKRMFEIETRYRVLEYKIKLIQEGLEIIVDLSKSERDTFLDLIIIALIAIDILVALVGGHIL
jgi:uncharacterized Rmd1/YagE family protein